MSRFLRGCQLVLGVALAAGAFMIVILPSSTTAVGATAPAVAVAQPVLGGSVERVAPEPRGRAVVVRVQTPMPTEEPPVPTDEPQADAAAAAPVVAAPARTAPPVVVAPPPQACPASYFCYPRLGIAGPIVPYNDCSGATDVGGAIRQLTCVRAGIWLAGHAYTQFGGITGYRAGDVVFVRGQRFEITGASVQRSCEPAQAIAPLSLQTSLEVATCGRVLVVQGR